MSPSVPAYRTDDKDDATALNFFRQESRIDRTISNTACVRVTRG
jgi:hypothetical protein